MDRQHCLATYIPCFWAGNKFFFMTDFAEGVPVGVNASRDFHSLFGHRVLVEIVDVRRAPYALV